MPLFICDICATIDNTALAKYPSQIREGREEILCSFCLFGYWHDSFPRERYDPSLHEIVDGFVKRK